VAQVLPEEYKCHMVVFNEKEATRFLPQREEEHGIELLPWAPKEIDCKVYPLSQVE
jgi:hypothetical protein